MSTWANWESQPMKAWKDGLQDISRIATNKKLNNFKKRYEVFPYWLNFSSCTPLVDKNSDNNDLILILRITHTQTLILMLQIFLFHQVSMTELKGVWPASGRDMCNFIVLRELDEGVYCQAYEGVNISFKNFTAFHHVTLFIFGVAQYQNWSE